MRLVSLASACLLAGSVAAYAQAPRGPAPADQYGGVPPASAYRGGAGSPFSNRSSNIDPADTRSEIAPRLPEPDAGGNNARAYLLAAQRALAQGRTGAAQEALERAQTRILTRSTDPALAAVPEDGGMTRAITEVRMALGHNDLAGARAILARVLDRAR